MQDSITRHKRFTASRQTNKPETQRVFDQAAGGARDVSAKEASVIRDRDFKAKQDMALAKERNKPLMENARQQKSNRVWEDLRGVIARKESDHSRNNAALLAENPMRENANRMVVGLQPQDRAALFGGVAGAGASSAISAKDRSVIEGNIAEIVDNRLTNNNLPTGIVMVEGEYVDEDTKEPVNVREVMMNEERTRVYGQANQAVSQIQGSTDFAGVLQGIGQANKMGLNWQDQLALSYRPTKPSMDDVGVQWNGGSGSYEDWKGSEGAPAGRIKGTPGYGDLSFTSGRPTAPAKETPAEEPATVADSNTEAVLSSIGEKPKEKTLGDEWKKAFGDTAKTMAKGATATGKAAFGAKKVAETVPKVIEAIKKISKMPAKTPERKKYFSTIEQNLPGLIKSGAETSDPLINELRRRYQYSIDKGREEKDAMGDAMDLLTKRFNIGYTDRKKI